jgi:hypothetical protein
MGPVWHSPLFQATEGTREKGSFRKPGLGCKAQLSHLQDGCEDDRRITEPH